MFYQVSADKHLLVSIGAINRARRGRDQNFQPASHAGQDRRQFTRRFDYLALNELGRVHDPFMGGIDGATDYFHFVFGDMSGFVRDTP